MPTAAEYIGMIESLNWDELQRLWEGIETRNTPQWEPGKAFEYLVLRAFQLDGAEVKWPYRVQLFGEEVEQIDGAIYHAGLSCLVESKDLAGNIAIGPIAKLRNQLLRRPAGSIGLVFSRTGFTDPARFLAHFALPQAILLWNGEEIKYALGQKTMCELLNLKYQVCGERPSRLRCARARYPMRAYVIVAGQSDAIILQALLPKELLEDTEIVDAGRGAATKSLARSLLVRRQTPVAVVVGADSVAPERVQECRESIEEAIESVAGGVPVKAVVAAPAMETIFFQDEQILTRVFGQMLSEHLLSMARIQPHHALKKLFDQSDHVKNLTDMLNNLTPRDIKMLQKSSIIQELIIFLQSTREFTSTS